MERDYWQKLLTTEEGARGYTDGFKLLFCPWRLIDTADTLFLSLNPGNDPSGEFMRIASDERGNSYLVQRQAKHSPIADQYRQLCEFIGKNPEEVLTGTLMPFRTPRWDKQRDAPSIEVTEPFWRNIFESGKIRQVFCMGRDVESAVVKQSKAQIDCQIPANWGNLSIRRYTTESGMKVYGLLHFSTYKMFGRAECLPQLAALLEIPDQ